MVAGRQQQTIAGGGESADHRLQEDKPQTIADCCRTIAGLSQAESGTEGGAESNMRITWE